MAQKPNTRCLGCGHDFHVVEHPSLPGYRASVDCPECGRHFDEMTVECWAQTIWPTPEHVGLGYFDP